MLYISITSKHKYSAETVAIIIFLHDKSKLLTQISKQLNLLRSIIATIIYSRNRQPDQLLRLSKWTNRPLKLDE